MGLLNRFFRVITRPVRAKMHGKVGEIKVNMSLSHSDNACSINNLTIIDNNMKTHQIDHVSIRENGIFCIETKSLIGFVFGDEKSKYWTQTLYTGERHYIYNPIKQNQSHCYHIKQIIGNNYIVNSIIVMSNNNADNISCSNVINLRNLKSYLNSFDNGVRLTASEINEIYQKLENANAHISKSEHIQNIRQTQIEISYNICPRCGGKLVLRKGKNGNFYGCSNYPKCRFTKNI